MGYIKDDKFKIQLYNTYGIKLITPYRKNMKKCITKKQKEQLYNRYKVEHTNNNTLNCNRIQVRFDKYISNFKSFIYLTCTNMICKFA